MMKTIGKIFLWGFLVSVVFGKIEQAIEDDDDTIVVEGKPSLIP